MIVFALNGKPSKINNQFLNPPIHLHIFGKIIHRMTMINSWNLKIADLT